jgi:hypothetical protein
MKRPNLRASLDAAIALWFHIQCLRRAVFQPPC